MKVYAVGIAGATCSGKSHFADEVIKMLGTMKDNAISVVRFSTDNFYRELNDEEVLEAEQGNFDFDNPNAINAELFIRTFIKAMDPKATKLAIPTYNFATKRYDGSSEIKLSSSDAKRIIIVEGIFALCFPNINKLYNLKLFIETDVDTRMSRRIIRDLEKQDTNLTVGSDANRGRKLQHILTQYEKYVKPGYIKHVEPTKSYADLAIPYNNTNITVVEMIALKCMYSKM